MKGPRYSCQPFLLAVDSDGCAFETMRLKHERFFAPQAIAVFGLEAIGPAFMSLWLQTNLYSAHRGRNRFEVLYLVLKQIQDETGLIGMDLDPLAQWLASGAAKSNESLRQGLKSASALILDKALEWSLAVNDGVAKEMPVLPPFAGVSDALQAASSSADMMVCSAANREALVHEWGEAGLLKWITVIGGQELGTKTEQLASAVEKGYPPGKILMIGDAPGDRAAAKGNGIRSYPILPGKEPLSWEEFRKTYWQLFLTGNYTEAVEEQLWTSYARHLG
jgi:phosphoglycolate phosphatase-like HAD superfamily hydrolase